MPNWYSHIAGTLKSIGAALAQGLGCAGDLRTPPRTADDSHPPTEAPDIHAGASVARPRTRSPGGLRRQLEGFLSALEGAENVPAAALVAAIQGASAKLEQQIQRRGLHAAHLTAEARSVRGWLALMARREHLEGYVTAAAEAREAFASIPSLRAAAQASNLRVHLRPMRGLYRVSACPGSVRVALPTAAICLKPNAFDGLAALAGGRRSARREVLEAMTAPQYRDLEKLLTRLGGEVNLARGSFHDLGERFDQVNEAYFAGAMSRPALAWSRRFSLRKLGHYDLLHDTVMVSATLDQPCVPLLAVDFIIYHELLHRHHGLTWENGRLLAHTREFRRDERRFVEYQQAQTALCALRMPKQR